MLLLLLALLLPPPRAAVAVAGDIFGVIIEAGDDCKITMSKPASFCFVARVCSWLLPSAGFASCEAMISSKSSRASRVSPSCACSSASADLLSSVSAWSGPSCGCMTWPRTTPSSSARARSR
jgi:hypothetical protein